MMVRSKNPIKDLSREQKIALGIAGGAVLGVVTLSVWALASKSDLPPPKKAIEIGEDCTAYAISSAQQLHDDLRAQVRAAAKSGTIDPLQVTARYLRRVAPKCPTYPEKTTPGQAQLFVDVYQTLLDVMIQENYLSTSDYEVWNSMMLTWAQAQGAGTEKEI